MPQTKKQIAVLLKEKQKNKMATSGILPTPKPSAPPQLGTPGLGAARFNLNSGRMDTLPRTRRGSR